jgi:hypothetical protein
VFLSFPASRLCTRFCNRSALLSVWLRFVSASESIIAQQLQLEPEGQRADHTRAKYQNLILDHVNVPINQHLQFFLCGHNSRLPVSHGICSIWYSTQSSNLHYADLVSIAAGKRPRVRANSFRSGVVSLFLRFRRGRASRSLAFDPRTNVGTQRPTCAGARSQQFQLIVARGLVGLIERNLARSLPCP